MRPAQKSGRSRGRGGRKGGGGGATNINRVYDSAGPEGKVRGTPQQIIDKYLSLARDAQTSGDRVTAENFLQHAEHYQRILITAMGAQEQARRDAAGPGDGEDDEQPQQPAPRSGDGRPAEAASAPEKPSADIGGMAMIDAGSSDDNLLVETGEMAAQPPRSNGENRRRRRRPAPEQPAAEASAGETGGSEATPPEAAAEG